MTVDLSCEFLGVKLKNPFLIASVPSACAVNYPKAAKAGWGGAVHWGGESITAGGGRLRGNAPREFLDMNIGKSPQSWAYENNCILLADVDSNQQVPPEREEYFIRKAKEGGIPVISNVFEGPNPEAWGKVAAAAERAGADILELNWSCPYLPGAGLEIGIDRDKRLATLKAVRDNSGLPVMVKLSSSLEGHWLAESVKGAVEAGADAVSITNTFTGLIGVDIETGMPLTTELCVDGKLRAGIGGISGPAIKPMGLRGVVEVRRAVNVPISGIGGITSWQDAVEYMLLGASTVQVGTAVMLFGFRMVRDLIKGLEEWMERKGYKTIKDFVGLSTDKYHVGEPYVRQEDKQPRKMIVDEDKCTGCGLCLVACEASGDSTVVKIEDRVAKIDNDICRKCNSCRIVCPEGAITVEWEPAYLV